VVFALSFGVQKYNNNDGARHYCRLHSWAPAHGDSNWIRLSIYCTIVLCKMSRISVINPDLVCLVPHSAWGTIPCRLVELLECSFLVFVGPVRQLSTLLLQKMSLLIWQSCFHQFYQKIIISSSRRSPRRAKGAVNLGLEGCSVTSEQPEDAQSTEQSRVSRSNSLTPFNADKAQLASGLPAPGVRVWMSRTSSSENFWPSMKDFMCRMGCTPTSVTVLPWMSSLYFCG
jgi:hypothetical protein